MTPARPEALEDELLSLSFFATGANGRTKFVPRRLAQHLADETPFAVGGEALFTYQAGAYRPGGEDEARRRIAEALGDEWKRTHADEVLAHLYATAPRLVERPPLDRVNCANGIFNLDAGELEDHDPGFLSPVQIAVEFHEGAECPAIERFLASVLPDPALRKLFFEIVAYLLTPDNTLQTAFMFLGSGNNGKSTAVNLLRALLGEPNASAVPLHRFEDDRFATADLYGKLANTFADLDSRALSSSSIFKSITGGDPLQAERKFRPAFTFKPYARMIYSANEAPPTPDSSDAFYRRWLIVPFERSFEGREDRNLLASLTTPGELSGLLNYGLLALPGLRARGRFVESEQTARAKERFKVDSDSVTGFVHDQCTLSLDGQVAKPTLYQAYKTWCGDNNRRAISAQRFNRQLPGVAGPEQLDLATVQGVPIWRGIALADDGPGA